MTSKVDPFPAMPPLRNLLGLWAFLAISGTASKVGGAGYDVSADCHSCYSSDAGNVTAVELLQTHVDLSSNGAQHAPFAPVKEWTTSPKVLRVSGGILLVCLLFVLGFGSTDILVGVAVFLDLFMTTVLTPLAPTLTADYQLIALLTSSKNIVTCLIAPFTGRFIDGNEAKSMQLGMLCAMFCTLSLAAATRLQILAEHGFFSYPLTHSTHSYISCTLRQSLIDPFTFEHLKY